MGAQTEPALAPASISAARDSPANPYLFVVGCQRSGTTMLQRMLDEHPHLSVGYDSHFIPRAVRGVATGIDPPLTYEIVEEVRTFPRFARLGLADAAVKRSARAARTYGQFVSRLYGEFAAQHGKPLAGEKSPGYCRHLPQLHGLFPWVRTIHLVRDGRDVALSILDWRKGPSKLDLYKKHPVATCALWWRRDVLAGQVDGAGLGADHYIEVRYEALVARPEPELQRVAAFLELPYVPQMAAFHEGRTRDKAGLSAKAAWLGPTVGLRDWRSQMSARDVEIFEAVAGDALEEAGYERACATISDEVAAIADQCRAWWDENVLERKERRRERPRRSDTVREARTAAPPAADRRGAVNPFLFVVGCPRSGTTLLKRIIDAHRMIAITPETHWIPRFWRQRTGIADDGTIGPEIVEHLLDYPKFANLRLHRGELESLLAGPEPVTYAAFVSGIFDLYAGHRGKPYAGDKTPGYVQEIACLAALWPRARFVHLLRDGRDVALSAMNWSRAHKTVAKYGSWADDRVSTAALWWERFVRLGREAAESLGPGRCHELRYESLLSDPAGECARLCDFLGVPYDDAMPKFHEGRTRDDPDLSAKKAWRPITAGLRDWRTQMPPEDAERFEAVAGDLLEELGYARRHRAPTAAAAAHARSMRDRFTKDPNFKERYRPRTW